MLKGFVKIKWSEIPQFLEDGGRTLVRAADFELRDGIKNGSRSYVFIRHETREVFLIPGETAQKIAHSYAVLPDYLWALQVLQVLDDQIRENI
ncbi:MAG: hypothetical protein FWF59_15505 [Turicibacter sp.]|nr:hypothetical protein [Turicibacter sp.]